MPKVVHITAHLGGGVGEVLTNIARCSRTMHGAEHEILCLDYLSEYSAMLCEQRGVTAHSHVSFDEVCDRCSTADIVQFDWWNHPLTNKFLNTVTLPAVRLLIYAHISGYNRPAVFTKEIVDFADLFAVSTPYSAEHPLFQSATSRIEKLRTLFIAGGSIQRVKGVIPREHNRFNVGYIGTVDFCKLHPSFFEMSNAAAVPGIQFIVCGEGGALDDLKLKASLSDLSGKFLFHGFVPHIEKIYEELDVFGYPLTDEHYGTGEQSLQEAMAAGVPPVVFAHGCESSIVKDNVTGLLVQTPEEYSRALEYLFHNPEERKRLGACAKEYAAQSFTLEATVQGFHKLYEELLAQPKKQRNFHKRFCNPDRSVKAYHIFLNSLGGQALEFEGSVYAPSPLLALASDEVIASSTPGMIANTKGSVVHYYKSFLNDPFLSYWAGLVLQKQEKHAEASQLFLQAIGKGFPDWRAYWKLSESLFILENLQEAKRCLTCVLEDDPTFQAGRELLERINSYGERGS